MKKSLLLVSCLILNGEYDGYVLFSKLCICISKNFSFTLQVTVEPHVSASSAAAGFKLLLNLSIDFLAPEFMMK